MPDHNGGRVGQQFGNYRLMSILGQGGFAEVYLGQHVFLNTQAAIKVLLTQLGHEEQENFLNEARIIASLIHPNIVRVLDFGTQGDIPFLVMDYAPNGSLRNRHPKGSHVPLETVVAYVKQIAAALQYAHDEKLIHRDVKPENMLLGRNDEILLSDFGISIVVQTTQSQNTQAVIGSVPYMAPEQLQGKPRPASDQYSLGIAVYEWLCGERPFQGGFSELYGQHLYTQPPSLQQKDPQILPEVDYVVRTALAKDPHQRFSSIRAFANGLEQVYYTQRQRILAAEPDAPTLPPISRAQTMSDEPSLADLSTHKNAPQKSTFMQRKMSRRVAMTGIAGLVIIGAGVTWYELSPKFSPQGTLIYANSVVSSQGAVRAVAWKGKRIASAGEDMIVSVWDATTGGNVVTYNGHKASSSNGRVNALTWSPDGKYIASASADQTVQVWEASTGHPKITYKGHVKANVYNNGVLAVAWSPDGSLIASGGDDGTAQIWTWDTSDSKPNVLYKDHQGQYGNSSVNALSWSPDGTRIATSGNDNTVRVWEAMTGKRLLVYNYNSNTVSSVAWSPDGNYIASVDSSKTVDVWSPSSPQDNIFIGNSNHTDTINSVAWSPDSKYIASASDDKTVQIWTPTIGATPYSYTQHADAVKAVAWAEDSHRIASGGDDKIIRVWEGI